MILSSKAYTTEEVVLHVYGLGKRLLRINKNKPNGCQILQAPEVMDETLYSKL